MDFSYRLNFYKMSIRAAFIYFYFLDFLVGGLDLEGASNCFNLCHSFGISNLQFSRALLRSMSFRLLFPLLAMGTFICSLYVDESFSFFFFYGELLRFCNCEVLKGVLLPLQKISLELIKAFKSLIDLHFGQPDFELLIFLTQKFSQCYWLPGKKN